MESNYFESGPGPTWHTDKFSRYVTEVASFDELLDFRAECLSNHPGFKPLLVIDDPDQAFYTSGHALEHLEAVDTEGFDAAQYAAHLLEQISLGLPDVDLDAMAGRMLAIDQAEVYLAEMNENPSALVAGRNFCILVPTNDQNQAFVGAVQSYFGPSPAEVFAMIRHFTDTFGYELVGLGATYIYFTRSSAIEGPAAEEVTDAVGHFHSGFDDEARRTLLSAIDGKTELIVTFRDW